MLVLNDEMGRNNGRRRSPFFFPNITNTTFPTGPAVSTHKNEGGSIRAPPREARPFPAFLLAPFSGSPLHRGCLGRRRGSFWFTHTHPLFTEKPRP